MLRDFTAQQWLTILTVQACTIVFGVTVTSVTVIIPQMKGGLAATQDQMAWVLTLNLVATAVATPLTGWLAAQLGWRRLMIGSLLGFGAASAACGTAQSLDGLLFARVVQGAFGAPIFPLGQAIILARFENRLHPLAIMMWGVGGVMGPILGPTFGGVIAELLDWRWTFFMILPLAIIAAVPAFLALGNEERGTARGFDFTGFVFIAVAVGALQLMLDRGQMNDWFASLEIIVEAALAAGFFYLYLVHTHFSPAPLFDPACFKDRNFVLGIIIALVMGMMQFTPLVLFPPLLQELRGYPETVVGYLMATRGIGNFLSFLIVAQMTRWNPQVTLACGLAVQGFAAAWMGQLNLDMTNVDVFWSNLLHGFGFGLAYTPMAVLAFSTLRAPLLTQANAIFSLVRMIGSSLFISIAVLIVVQSTATATLVLGTGVSIFDDPRLLPWQNLHGAVGGADFQNHARVEITRQAAMIGYLNAFHLLTLTPLLFAPLVFFFRRRQR